MKKKILATAVSAGLVSVASLPAHADSVLGTVFSTVGSAATFASIVNKQDASNTPVDPAALAQQQSMHWTYIYKINSDDPAEACQHNDGFASQTLNDLGTFNLRDPSGAPLFTDTTSSAYTISTGFAGMFIVSNGVSPTVASSNQLDGTLVGEVIVADPAVPIVGSYRMINDPVNIEDGQFPTPPWFTAGTQAPPLNRPPTIIWHPTGVLSTNWYVAVAGNNMQLAGSLSSMEETIQLEGSFTTAQANQNAPLPASGSWYDRNERVQSTSAKTSVNCFGRITLEDLIDPAGLGAAANGGWAQLLSQDPPVGTNGTASDFGILVYKTESNGVRSILTSENRVDW